MLPKVCILVWKDLLYRRNKIIRTVLELLIPISFIILINTQLTLIDHSEEADKWPQEIKPPEQGPDCRKIEYYSYLRKVIIYEPSNPFIENLMNTVACSIGMKRTNIKPGKLTKSEDLYMGIKFDGIEENQSTAPESLKYTLYIATPMFKNDKLWEHKQKDIFLGTHLPPYPKDVLEFQNAIDHSFLKIRNFSNVSPKTLLLQNMDVVGYQGGSRVDSILMPFLIASIYLFSNVIITSTLVREKISGAKELVLMMGIKRWQIWMSKFIDALLPLTVIITIVIVLFHIPLATKPVMLMYVGPLDNIFVFVLGTISIITFLFFLSCLFTSVLATVLVTSALWLIILVMDKFIIYLHPSKFIALLKCLIPHVALLEATSLHMDFEWFRKDVKYTERLSSRSDALTLLEILLMMGLDIVLFSILTWYLEQVFPGKYGIPQSPIFFFKKSYWNPSKVENSESNAKTEIEFYEEARGLSEGIAVQNISKIYKRSGKDSIKAVDNVSIDFYENEITGLLGHNGAGKTTLISIICGLTAATSGKVLVNGYDVAKNTDDARKSLGLCPQHDLLFPALTAMQNIAFYGMIKGLSQRKAYKEAKSILKRFKMDHVKNTKAGKLSGGQKRKVSLAIALVGDSKVIVLDEPTSGLDPEIRREIWDILLPLRGSKTVILTTHFMEEADALCNRIAIMDQGKVKCYATPMMLKAKYGTGYTLSVVAADLGKVSKIRESVKEIIKTSLFKSQNALTLYFQLPESEKANFPALFDNLDSKKTANEILTYSLNISTLEDVFLKVSHDAAKKNGVDTVDASPYKRFRSTDELQANKYSIQLLIFCQIFALFGKKFVLFKRKLVPFIILNVVFIGLILLEQFALKGSFDIFKASDDSDSNKTIPFSLDIYHKSDVFLNSDSADGLVESFEKVVKDYGSNIVRVDNITAAYRKTFFTDYSEYINILLGVEFHEDHIFIHHNNEARQIPPISINLINNAYLKAQGTGRITAAIGFQYVLKETDFLHYRSEPNEGFLENEYSRSCPISNLITFPTFIAFFFFIGLMEERSHGAKHLQLMLTPVMIYWLTHLFFDIFVFAIIIAVIYVLDGLADEKFFKILKDRTGLVVTSLVLWSIALLLLYYAVTTRINNPGGVYIFGVVFLFVSSFFAVLSPFGDFFRQLSYLHPTTLAEYNHEEICKNNKAPYTVGLAIYCGIMLIYLFLADSKIIGTIFHKFMTLISKVNYNLEYRKDAAVDLEEENVKNIIHGKELSSKALVVADLKRWFFSKFKKFGAVKGVSFSVNHGECFGLLGVNGAGKTSTFGMLTGELVPSGGNAFVSGVPLFNVFTRSKALFKIGYCPQSGGFIPCFSGKENLVLFAKLRGIRCSLVRKEVRKWIEKMGLEDHKKKRCLHLSGGNQRKLATAIALIGDSPLLFLDEPTTGVDPAGRRSIWNQISDLREEGQSVVLTSHSMDECEALCTRLTIMVKGQLCCIGETAVLKDTFGQGYSVLVKISVDATRDDREKLKKEMKIQFDPKCNLTDEHLTTLQYHITNTTVTWKKLFSKLSDIQKKFRFLESYSASATTLEQLFLYFARSQ